MSRYAAVVLHTFWTGFRTDRTDTEDRVGGDGSSGGDTPIRERIQEMYNVVEKLRSGEPLTTKEREVHTLAACGVLRDVHDELDGAVSEAYRLDVANRTRENPRVPREATRSALQGGAGRACTVATSRVPDPSLRYRGGSSLNRSSG